MKLNLILLLNFICALTAVAQNKSGITNIRDTSFSTKRAYLSLIKTMPDVKVVTEFKSPRVAEKRKLVYCDLNGRKLHVDAFYPTGRSGFSRPAVVIVHGGGWRSGSPEQHVPMAQRLAAMGYVCFTVEYRLSTEALYPAAVNDLKSAIRWLRTQKKKFGIDTSKIAILGFSAGGELAAFVGATNQSLDFKDHACHIGVSDAVHGIVDIDGTLSFVHAESGEGDDRKSISAASYWFGYAKKENPELWKAASPLTHVGKNTPPTLFLNSSVDRMHAGRDDFKKVLDQYGIYNEVHTFEKAPHAFCLFEPWFEPTVQYVDGFLKRIFK
jgi:acetyl esterase/lipase